MDQEVKQRNRRRKRAQRMQAQRENNPKQRDGDSADEDIVREKPQRPPNRRKKSKEPLCEEDIIDGFAILGFKTYDDLELVLKISSKENIKRLVEIERPKLETKERITHHISVHSNHALTLTHDLATSDDSGRASERLTGSSVPPRDADSSRDRLSDASSRCSSGKGYICDSEGEDDKGSDASSVIFGSAPASRKHEFPGALPPSLPLSNGLNGSPVPAPTPPNLPAPSPAPAQLPPVHPPVAISSATVPVASTPTPVTTTVLHKPPQDSIPCMTPTSVTSMPPVSIPVTMPQQAAAPLALHPAALDPSSGPGQGMRTDSPAVGTSANAAAAPGTGGKQYHQVPTYQPMYAPYSVHQPYASTASATAASVPTAASASAPTSSAVTTVATSTASAMRRTPTPVRAQPSPGIRERESYSNVSSLSRGSTTPQQQQQQPQQQHQQHQQQQQQQQQQPQQLPPMSQQQPVLPQSCPPPTTVSSSLVLSKPWSSTAPVPTPPAAMPAPQPSSAPLPPRPTPPLHPGFPAPMFAAPLPPVSTASPHAAPVQPTAQPPQSNPFSAENLFQTNQTDMLRRELDNRFLASQDRGMGVAPPPYLRTEMHQHQHHHTHVHQHTTSLLPPPAGSALFPSPLTMNPMNRLAGRPGSSFKDIPKLGGVESPFYRQNLGIPNYPGYTPPGLMHPGLTAGPTPFVPPTHLPTFQPKKSGKWNAMHVRVAWEIYHHQQKSGEAKGSAVKTDLLRPPTHLFSPSVHSTRPHELAFPPSLSSHRPPGFDQPHPSSLFTAPPSHLMAKSPFTGSTLSPFSRYGAGGFPGAGPSPFGLSHFASTRDMGLGGMHDPWRSMQRSVGSFPPSVNPLPPTLPGLPPPAPWSIKPDPILEQREREAREREERERERLRREREERERREREEKQRRLEQQQQEQRERERREKERREMERREMERERERERERMLHQQRMAESAKQVMPSMRDRSPHRSVQELSGEIRVKEEPRIKEEDMLSRTAPDPRYAPHSYLRHHPLQPPPPPSMLDRSRMMQAHGLHYPGPPATHWPPQHDPFYRYDALRYNPLMDAIRAEEERAKLFGTYAAHHPPQMRTKDPSLMHLRPGPGPPPPPSHHLSHKMSVTPPTDLHKKEEPR
ncbi:extensin-like isoform X3 [Harmonia axyridis]|uniref:extensin-like isoform X3 n=1 Tax=Harmonia axyridis TaxID=115357 RepID=UPI001E276BAD|nr:extensin-like isoform X3 [Harmonia axyridis]